MTSTASGGPKVVMVGGGFGGVNVTRKLAKADVDVTSRSSIARTTTSSSRCCTRWRPGSCRRV